MRAAVGGGTVVEGGGEGGGVERAGVDDELDGPVRVAQGEEEEAFADLASIAQRGVVRQRWRWIGGPGPGQRQWGLLVLTGEGGASR